SPPKGERHCFCRADTGKTYCLPREITEKLGAAWPGQHTKLTRSQLFQKHIMRNDIVTHDQRRHELLLLDVDYLPTWLASMCRSRSSSSRVHGLPLRFQPGPCGATGACPKETWWLSCRCSCRLRGSKWQKPSSCRRS